jgi:hypothetical protein
MSSRLTSFVAVACLALVGACHGRPDPLAEEPSWVVLQIARASLDAPGLGVPSIGRARYRGAPIYVIGERCCDMGGHVLDAHGRELDGFGGFGGAQSSVLFEATSRVTLWQAVPWSTAAAQKVLDDPRLAGAKFVRAFAQLEVNTGVAWAAIWPDDLHDGPPSFFRLGDRERLPLPDARTSPEQAALAFVTQNARLFDVDDPAAQVSVARDELPAWVPAGATETFFRRSGSHPALFDMGFGVLVNADSQVTRVDNSHLLGR